MNMTHPAPLVWQFASPTQARGVLQRNAISGRLFTEAKNRLLDPEWFYGPHVFLFDNLTGKAARVTVQGPDEFDIVISSRTADVEFDTISEQMPALIDHVVVMN